MFLILYTRGGFYSPFILLHLYEFYLTTIPNAIEQRAAVPPVIQAPPGVHVPVAPPVAQGGEGLVVAGAHCVQAVLG